ncbi:MAG: class I SAM-dependent methyltransferase [Candidatus Latescibacterota bacterium]|nr:MAG: class I SAM-dependent methyltransferase [Candidatus Latescibacterota bacterium]
MEYDKAYSNTENLFGTQPEKILKNHIKMLSGIRPVLDIGAGQGRHALFLARKGFIVDAIDPSRVAIETLSNKAAKEKLHIRAHQCGFEDFVPQTDYYSGIAVFGLLQTLSWRSIGLLVDKIGRWTGPGTLIFVTTFTTADPLYDHYAQTWTKIGKNSFSSDDGSIRTYFKPGEVLELFDPYETVHHWEGMGPRHRHGDGPLERHAKAEAVFLRRK